MIRAYQPLLPTLKLPEPGIGRGYTNERPVLAYEYPTLKKGKSGIQVANTITQVTLTHAAAMLADKKLKRVDVRIEFPDPSIGSHDAPSGKFSYSEFMKLYNDLRKNFGQTDAFKDVSVLKDLSLRVSYSMNSPNVTIYLTRGKA